MIRKFCRDYGDASMSMGGVAQAVDYRVLYGEGEDLAATLRARGFFAFSEPYAEDGEDEVVASLLEGDDTPLLPLAAFLDVDRTRVRHFTVYVPDEHLRATTFSMEHIIGGPLDPEYGYPTRYTIETRY
jgi:hypothetical protein